MAALAVLLLGNFELRAADGALFELQGQKNCALLALLATPPGAPHLRDRLASLLWSDRGERQARDSLKHALASIRNALRSVGLAPIVADRHTARLDDASVSVDTAEFERLLADGSMPALAQAMALYRGDLLDGIRVSDPAFDDWLLMERERLRNMADKALTQLLTGSLAASDWEQTGIAARRLLSLDPFREDACRALMRLHAGRGETAPALKLYATLRDRLHRELGVKPAQETKELCDAIELRRGGARSTAETTAPNSEPSPPVGSAAAEVGASLPLPEKPSIAVLPFRNLSGDIEQEYFGDGMVEEIVTALSRMRWLFVIARNSSFTYKGKAVDVRQVARELGVRYVLEGSIRRSGNRIRITGELIDGTSGAALWADRFEGELEDIFDLQDQMTARVVGAIAPQLVQAEIDRTARKPTELLDAYDHYLRGMACVHRWTREANGEALRHFYRAIELDPAFASAYGMAARCYSQRKVGRWMTDRAAEAVEANRLAQRVKELGRNDAVALCTAGMALAYVVGDLDDGGAMVERALALNPNFAWAWLFSGWVNAWRGDAERAIEHVTQAIRLSPQDPQLFNMHAAMACAHFFARRPLEAWTWAEMAMRAQPDHIIATCVASAGAALAGRPDEAQQAMARLRALEPGLCISNLRDVFPIGRPEDFERLADGLRLCGLPERNGAGVQR